MFFRDYEPKITVVDDYWWPQIEIDSRTGVLGFPHDGHQARKSFGGASSRPCEPPVGPFRARR